MEDKIINFNVDDIKKLLAKLSAITQESVIKKTLSRGTLDIAGWSLKYRLRGPRPTYLGVVSGRLRASITATEAVKTNEGYEAEVGTNVVYAPIHEYGGTFWIPQHWRRTSRIQKYTTYKEHFSVDSEGEEVMSLRRVRKSRRVLGGDISIKGHFARFPERSFLRSSLNHQPNQQKILNDFVKNIGKAIEDAK